MTEEKKEDKKDDYVNITEDGGVKKKILKEGTGELPVEGSEVHVNYIGRNSDNKVFDQTKDKPFTFKLGGNQVIKGWEIGVKTMKVGEKAEFILAPNYAYGNKKMSDLIPENATLTFEIELLKFVVPKKEISDMTYEEKLAEGKKLKGEGVEKFKAKDIAGARDLFTRAIAYLETMDKTKEAEAEGVNLYATTLSNLCNCCNQQKEYHAVVNFATKGLKVKELPKFYYFRAIANANNDEFKDAKQDLSSLKKLLGEKEDAGVKFVEELIEKRQKEISAKRKKFSKGLFSQHLYDDIDKKEEELYKESTEPFMQIVSRELIEILNKPENRKCFDCDSSPANWICVNNAIFLCSKCAGEHRGYGTIISNLKFMMLDKLNEFQIEIMKRGGNKKLDKLLEEYKVDKKKVDKLILYSSKLLEYHRDCLYNQLAGKPQPKPPTKFEANKIMNNFKDNPRPPLEKVKTKEEIFIKNENKKDNNLLKGNCKSQ